jgi:enoyl-CoA hydratase
MALSCDFILATHNAQFGLPEVSLGLIPGFGGTQRLARIIGRNKAKELIYTGALIKADEALSLGLALYTFASKAELMEQSLKLMSKINKNSPYAVKMAKKVINEGVDLTVEAGLELEKNQFADIFNSFDQKEGCKAFVEKRKANFQGK